jgi:hypothetical protein
VNQLPADIGPTLTLSISDDTETLSAVIEGYHPQLPVLPPRSTQEVHRGDTVSIPFSSVEPPDEVSAGYAVDWPAVGDTVCSWTASLTPTLGDGQVMLAIPTTLCPASIGVCLGFKAPPRVTSCVNATCELGAFDARTCQSLFTIAADPPPA